MIGRLVVFGASGLSASFILASNMVSAVARAFLEDHATEEDYRLALETLARDRNGRNRVVAIGILGSLAVQVRLNALGPDAEMITRDEFRTRIGRGHAPVKARLLDQSVLAGVGNVYRAEVLFRHRIHPLRLGRNLTKTQFLAMWDDLVLLMTEGVASGRIDTVRPEHTPEAMGRPPRMDGHGGEVYVYRRTGQPCLVCGTPVRTAVLSGRNLFWCAKCQPAPRARH